MKKRVLFLCTYNSCRSQMAEGLVNHYLGDRFQAFSAGLETKQVNLLAFRVLAQVGIDISHQFSKTISVFEDQRFDHVISLCGENNEKYPEFIGGVKLVHMGFDDPSRLSGPESELLPEFRRVRDEIRDRVIEYLQNY